MQYKQKSEQILLLTEKLAQLEKLIFQKQENTGIQSVG